MTIIEDHSAACYTKSYPVETKTVPDLIAKKISTQKDKKYKLIIIIKTEFTKNSAIFYSKLSIVLTNIVPIEINNNPIEQTINNTEDPK